MKWLRKLFQPKPCPHGFDALEIVQKTIVKQEPFCLLCGMTLTECENEKLDFKKIKP